MNEKWELVLDLLRLCNDRHSVIQLHSLTFKTGHIQDSFIVAKLSNSYSRYASLEATRKLFDETPQPTLFMWNCTLKCYCKDKLYGEALQLFRNMISVQKPDCATVSIALKACSGLQELRFGRMLHGFVKKNHGLDAGMFVGSALIDLYSKCGRMSEALTVFEEFPQPDIVLWTHIVTGYEQNGEPDLALAFFSRMVMEGCVTPDSVTLISVLSACSQLSNVKDGSSVHGFVIKKGFRNGLSVCNALLNLYVKSGSVKSATKLFREMEEKDEISWASVISCYAHNGASDEALHLFDEMMRNQIEPNSVTIISALQACETTCKLEEGKKIHEIADRKGVELDVLVATALIEMYMNCSSPDEAIELFERMPNKDAVSWAALLSGCVRNGMAYKSMELFLNMMSKEIQPDAILIVNILTACSELGVLQQALCLHGYVIKGGFEDNIYVGASLIEAYSKCGSLGNAIKVFEVTDNRDVVIWSSMIAGYGIHGQGREALELFNEMVKKSQVKPNKVTFLSVLSACSHAGLIKDGMELFNIMLNEYRLVPESNHYAIMVDLFGRTGDLDKAVGIINQMPVAAEPHVWGALLGACRIHNNTRLGEMAARNLFQSDSSHAGYFILLANIYAIDKDWDTVAKLRNLMKQKKLKKIHGQSAVEVKSEVHSFTAGDRFHPQGETIHGYLRSLEVMMREESYIPDMGFQLNDSMEVI